MRYKIIDIRAVLPFEIYQPITKAHGKVSRKLEYNSLFLVSLQG